MASRLFFCVACGKESRLAGKNDHPVVFPADFDFRCEDCRPKPVVAKKETPRRA